MANPLQPKVIKCLENDFDAYVINLTSASKAGNMDVLACIKGEFFGFEVKWKSDQPSLLQKQKINACINAGGKAFFTRSIAELRDQIAGTIKPVKYELGNKFTL